MSGAGKSTIGQALYDRLKLKNRHLVMLDGDQVRAALAQDVGHDPKSRDAVSRRYANLCHLLDQQEIHAICCAVTVSEDAQALNRERLSGYMEILLEASLDTLKSRDPKGIYERAFNGDIKNVAGVDIPFVRPVAPHLVINNDVELKSVSGIVDDIVYKLPSSIET